MIANSRGWRGRPPGGDRERPNGGGTVEPGFDRHGLYVANTDHGSISRIDLRGSDMKVYQTGREPTRIARAGNRVYVTDRGDRKVSVFEDDGGQLTAIGTIQVGAEPFGVVANGLLAGMEAAEVKHGLTSKLILCFLRHLDEEDAFKTLTQAQPWIDRIEAVGLDSSEVGHPPSKFERVFTAAAAMGLKRVAHAGEEGPPEYVHEALDLLHIDRLDHGNRSLEDPALVTKLARTGMTLTVCPLSNVKLCNVASIDVHPIDDMLRKGLRATINSDDPAYFGGYVGENYRAVAKGRGLGRDDLVTLARNSFLGSFLPDDVVAAHLARLDAYVEAHA